MEGGLRVLVAGLLNGGKSEGASGWVVQWRELEGASGWVVHWRVV